MTTNKIKLNIVGTEYSIVSDEPVSYMTELGMQIDKEMREIMQDPRVSTTMAAVLVAYNSPPPTF